MRSWDTQGRADGTAMDVVVTPGAGGRVGDGTDLPAPPGGVTTTVRAKHLRREETRLERRAREAVEELRQPPALRAAIAAQRVALLARRRRTVLVLGAVGVPLCLLVTAASALIAAGFVGDHLTWWIAVGAKRRHWVGEYGVATTDAARFALAVTAIPVVLAALSYLALRLPGVRDKAWAMAPAWVGAYVMPGLALGVLASFVGSSTGQSASDPLPLVAQVAPQALPLLLGGVAVLVRADRGRRTPRLEALG
ncbi:hypothetical protein [Cellulomonas terrae]|uniref:Uncharacterized protein n=1 Tax=Cellulomonas terrae TaxID=311234 RepID=A0A511JRP5_9CELL|nr:hypothetical protein [Cellulomonas terrae]GEM00174.1 hypothetical protein CTE05_37200 [Cellulomonas terrae]